jgi:DNA-binding transcriptional MerR regulator
MRELVRLTGVARETIHFYAREGLLPPAVKTHPNQADYTEDHVERVLFIKKLQEKLFLPLPMIKKIIALRAESPMDGDLLKIKSDYFTPADHFMPEQLVGVAAFLEYTGMSKDRLADFESYGIIASQVKEKRQKFSRDAIQIGRLIGDMRRRGLSYEKGFRREGLKEIRDRILPAIEHMALLFEEGLDANGRSAAEIHRLAVTAVELLPLFIYYVSRIHLKRVLGPHILPNGG